MKNLILIVGIILICSSAYADQSVLDASVTLNTNPVIINEPEELKERNAIKIEARKAFINENFDKLNQLADHYNLDDKFTSSGVSKSNHFDEGTTGSWAIPEDATEDYFIHMSEKAKRWWTTHPTQPAAHYAYITALIQLARFYSTTRSRPTASLENIEEYHYHTGTADMHVQLYRDQFDSDIYWYKARARVMFNTRGQLIKEIMDADTELIEKLVKEAEKKFDGPERLHKQVLWHYLPTWYGDIESLDHFINRSALQTKNRTADEHYARLYSNAADFYYRHGLFIESPADWERMKRGFEEIGRKYPTEWNKNIFAHFACIAGDKTTAKRLLTEIGSTPILEVWKPNEEKVYSNCTKWVDGSGPPIINLVTLETL